MARGSDVEIVSALDARSRLEALETERALVLGTRLHGITAYMSDLEAEIEATRRIYVAAAVTEIATLRAELFGPDEG
ncbi:MAG: hypothetical protein H0U84_05190 [Thermoleophilaceae bacterium]|nr:hypothetical protein [Thermoleophilaceae bacterium]